MPTKIVPWSQRAIREAKKFGIRKSLVAATGYSEDHLSMCINGRRATSPDLADKLVACLELPASNFGQRTTAKKGGAK